MIYLAAIVADGLHGCFHGRVIRFTLLHLCLEVVFVIRADHEEVLTPLIHCDLSFGLDDGVNSPHWRRGRGTERRRRRDSVNAACGGAKTFVVKWSRLNKSEIRQYFVYEVSFSEGAYKGSLRGRG